MRLGWNLDISAAKTEGYDKNGKSILTSDGYNILIHFDVYGIGAISTLTWQTPAIAIVDDDMRELADIKYLDAYTKIFYKDFMLVEIGITSHLAMLDLKDEDGNPFSIPGTTLSCLLDQTVQDTPRNISGSGVNVTCTENGIDINFRVIPKRMDLISTKEKELSFTREVAEFFYSNVIVHVLDALDIVAAEQEKEPEFAEKCYTREEILSKIDDPFGHIPKIVIGKVEKKPGRGNLEYTRKVISKTKTTKSEDENGDKESAAGTED